MLDPRFSACPRLSGTPSGTETIGCSNGATLGVVRGRENAAVLPDEVSPYLEGVTAQVADVLGSELVGIYTSGSLALGDYHHGRSDIDLIAVAFGSIALDRRAELARRLDHQVLVCPAAGLELVLYPLATVATPTLEAGYLLNLNTGRSLKPEASFKPADTPAFWFAIDRDVTRQSGAALIGPSPAEVFATIPFDELLGSVVVSMEAHAAALGDHLLDNAVLNGCRALCFGNDHRWYPKLEAAARVLPHAGEFDAVVREAMDSFLRGRTADTTLTPDAVRAFLAEVLRRLHAVRCGAPPPKRIPSREV